MNTQHSLSDVLKRLVLDIDNMNSFLYSLQNILESQSENVNVNQIKSDGTSVNITVPSFGYLKGKIDDINTRFDTLLSTNSDTIGIKSSTGEVRKFELKKTSKLLQDLEEVQNSEFTVPNSFKVKNNWFFESFLNPLLYVSVDIASILTEDIDQFVVKRIIFNAAADDDVASFFDENYKGVNDVSLSALRQELDDTGIDYFEDDTTVDLAIPVNRFKGSFDVVRILEEEGNQTLANGQAVSTLRRRYKLSTLSYTDVLSDSKNTRVLSQGDILITDGDSEYKIVSINVTDTEVVLERIFGVEAITIGADILRLKPSPYRLPELQVNVGFNERQIIFVKPISRAKNLTTDDFSKGFGIYTNELTIPLPDNSVTTLEDYYNNFVSDFGLILLNMAKEKTQPAVIGVQPDPPAITTDNFRVVQIDEHLQDDKNIADINNDIKEKAQLQQEVDELSKKIDSIKSSIATVAKSSREAKRFQKQLSESLAERNEKSAALTTLVNNITLRISSTPQFVTDRLYRVIGFWQIPDAKSTKYGKQAIVQFKYRYRYLSSSGTQPNAKQLSFVDADGATKSATFSPWTEAITKPRVRELNTETGLYGWVDEVLTDSDSVNTNQLDISIRKGEIVEIQIKSLSEAGWPNNPTESEWSAPIQVRFPDEISSQEEATVISQKTFAQQAKLDFENTLISRGIDTHIANQFTSGDKFYGHVAEDIASGFFTSEGNVIDLYQKLKELESTLAALKESITVDQGVLKVSIIDSDGTSLDVANGDTINLFAGHYKDLIKDTTGGTVIYNEGAIITKQYVISIQNTSATGLELISALGGGIGQLAEPLSTLTGLPIPTDPTAYPDSDYHVNRRYDVVPIAVNSNPIPFLGDFKHRASYQSGQVKSQFIHSRVKEYGLSEELYLPSMPTTSYPLSLNTSYNYEGVVIGSTRVPYNWGHYLPFRPDYNPGGAVQSPKVWNGNTNASSRALGNGRLTEFCISVDHPAIPTLCGANFSVANIDTKFRPTFNAPVTASSDSQPYLPFSHAVHMETSFSEGSNVLGAKYYKQASRITPTAPISNSTRNDSNYPIKLGFTKNDEYLIGKYTCGAYLYLYPTKYEDVSIEGNLPGRSSKTVKAGSENAINIPVLFQFRASDRLGYIGGFRVGSTLANIEYSKKIGIDLIIKNQPTFSFDLSVNAKYLKETTLDAPLVQSKGTTKKF